MGWRYWLDGNDLHLICLSAPMGIPRRRFRLVHLKTFAASPSGHHLSTEGGGLGSIERAGSTSGPAPSISRGGRGTWLHERSMSRSLANAPPLSISVAVHLTPDEALVLFELLGRYETGEQLRIVVQLSRSRCGGRRLRSNECLSNRWRRTTRSSLNRPEAGCVTQRANRSGLLIRL